MKTRIVTGVVAAVAAIAALLFFPVWAIRLLMTVISLIAVFELLSVGGIRHKGVMAAAFLFAASCPFLDMTENGMLLWAALLLYITVLAMIQVFCHKALSFEQIAYVVCVSVTVVLPLSCLMYLRAMPTHGLAYLFLALIVAWCSDTGAYFVGSFFGKHKLCEHISPKKTVEGFVGGIVCAVGIAVLAAVLYQQWMPSSESFRVSYWVVALVALAASPVSVVGDLYCSVIKRHYKIKDFGKLFPGHGGVLDRFDSLVFVAPMMYVLCSLVPMIHML